MSQAATTDRSRGREIHPPTEEEKKAALDEFFADQRKIKTERRAAYEVAAPALERLCRVMPQCTGQSYKIRALLYSLWNGQPVAVNEVLGLDWDLRKDVCAVILAFGFEDGETQFWYEAIQEAVTRVGRWEWFREAHNQSEQ